MTWYYNIKIFWDGDKFGWSMIEKSGKLFVTVIQLEDKFGNIGKWMLHWCYVTFWHKYVKAIAIDNNIVENNMW